jgi:tight adherence protein C
MLWDGTLAWAAFVMVSSLWLLVTLVAGGGRRSRLDTRLQALASDGGPAVAADPVAEFARSALPKMGAALLPKSDQERTKLQTRLIHAGLYSRQAMALYLGVKMLFILSPPLVGVALGLAGVIPTQHGLIYGALAGAFGVIAPSFWLDQRKAERQTNFRRALPDALDVLVICLEGGASLPSAIARVATELRTAHPLLATELNIVEREIQLGRSAGEALREFADRSDLEEVRSLASVVLQSERFGASLVRALRVHAESFRTKRVQRAEELAQKAVIKMLFPTVLFILPAMFIAILGPLLMEVLKTLNDLIR